MSISETFQELEKRHEGALIAYVTGGDPAPKYTPRLVEALVEGGADIVEIGIPFSDPIADGPIIQAADCRALTAGTTPRTIFEIVKRTKKNARVPIALLTYYNIIFRMGVENFLGKAVRCGVDGLIIPDLPVEEAEEYRELAGRQGIDTIFLATPSTSPERLKKVLRFTSGFLYLVSLFGVTGTRDRLTHLTTQTIRRLHPYTATRVPLAVGFGISKPGHVRAVIDSNAEGAIVGSAFVRTVELNLNKPTRMVKEMTALAKRLKRETKPGTNKTQAGN